MARIRRTRLGAADGFTLLETLLASVVLIVGVLGAFGLLDVSAQTIAATRAREGAVNLAREILEDSRTVPFSEVSSTIGERLQQLSALAPKSGGSGWQIERRGFTYTVTVEACSIDDPKDGLGSHDSTFCPNQEQGTADPTPIDLKRITAKIANSD